MGANELVRFRPPKNKHQAQLDLCFFKARPQRKAQLNLVRPWISFRLTNRPSAGYCYFKATPERKVQPDLVRSFSYPLALFTELNSVQLARALGLQVNVALNIAPKNKYNFITVWKVHAPLSEVWPLIIDVLAWSDWWKGVLRVKELTPGVYHHTWQSVIPYKLKFTTGVVKITEYRTIEAAVTGELEGAGKWEFVQQTDQLSIVTYHWNVRTTRTWMNLTGPFLKGVFRWSHNKIMEWGARGIAKKLDCKVEFDHN